MAGLRERTSPSRGSARRSYLSLRRQQHLQTNTQPSSQHKHLTTGTFAFPKTRQNRPRAPKPQPTMPTPESEMFKAAKPTVPPTFDGVDYDDNKALKAAQDSVIREQWVQSMMARLVREELGKCYYREGVNHLEKCGHLRGKNAMSRKHLQRGGEGGPIGVVPVVELYEMCANAFCACRSLLGAAQALEGQGLPVPAAELRSQGVGFGRSLGWKKRDLRRGNHPHRNVQYAKRIHTRKRI